MNKIYLLLSLLILMISCQKADEFIENSSEDGTLMETRASNNLIFEVPYWRTIEEPEWYDCPKYHSYFLNSTIDFSLRIRRNEIYVPEGYNFESFYVIFSSTTSDTPTIGRGGYYYSEYRATGTTDIHHVKRIPYEPREPNKISNVSLDGKLLPKGNFRMQGFVRYSKIDENGYSYYDYSIKPIIVLNNYAGFDVSQTGLLSSNCRLTVTVPDDGIYYFVNVPVASTTYFNTYPIPVYEFKIGSNMNYTFDVNIRRFAGSDESKTIKVKVPRTPIGETIELSCSWD